MGQPIVVVERPAPRPGVAAFEINRSLTGMGHERYAAGDAVTGDRPPDVLARGLLDDPRVRVVHVYSNTVTVELAPFATSDGLAEFIRSLFVYYRPGVEVAEPEAPEAEAEAS